MKFANVVTSMSDYPKHVASVIYTLGCNLRCPYCYNHLLFSEFNETSTYGEKERSTICPVTIWLSYSSEDIVKVLENRRKRIGNFICITGGEPTIHGEELVVFLKKLTRSVWHIKLDTNGLNPKVLKQCLPYVDYVAMDIKTALPKYAELNNFKPVDTANILDSIKMVMSSGVDYHFRTTVVPSLINECDIMSIGSYINGAKKYVLQQFYPENTYSLSYRNLVPYSSEQLRSFKDRLKEVYRIKQIDILD